MDLRLQAVVRDAAQKLKSAEIPDALREASLLIAAALTAEPQIVHLEPARNLTDAELHDFNKLVARRVAREPMAYVLGHREFWSLDFLVSPDVLDPRPDSETLIEAALDLVKAGFDVRSILDLGTGSGCLLLTLLSEIKGTTGIGVDISEKALDIAGQNAKRLELQDVAHFRQGRWCEGITTSFDLVVSNPPYISAADIDRLQPEVRLYEPHLALDGGDDGLDCYRQILMNADNVLRPGGVIIFELGAGQASEVAELMLDAGLNDIVRHRDLAGIERVIVAHKSK